MVFVSLGSWQIIRLNWKNNLILEIENSLKKPPVELSKTNKENYLKIKTSGSVDCIADPIPQLPPKISTAFITRSGLFFPA